MKRVWLFAAVGIVSLAGFLIMVVWYLSDFQSGTSGLGSMMGQMMGGGNAAGTNLAMPFYFPYLALTFIGLAVLGVIGLIYFMTYPEIPRKTVPTPPQETVSVRPEPPQSWDFLLK